MYTTNQFNKEIGSISIITFLKAGINNIINYNNIASVPIFTLPVNSFIFVTLRQKSVI